MIRFQCPTCRTVLQTAARTAGTVVACARCQTRLRVPAPPPKTPLWPIVAAVCAVVLMLAVGVGFLIVPLLRRPTPPVVAAPKDPPPPPEDKRPIVAPPMPSPVAAALDAINAARAEAGAPPLRLDASKQAASLAQSLLKRPTAVTFDEEHPADAIAWKAPAAAATDWLAGPLHRDLLLARDRETLGVGTARDAAGREVTVIDGLFADQIGVGNADAVVYPAPGQMRVPLLFPGNEVPDPLPDVKDKLAGYPVTVQFARRSRVSAVEALMEDDSGTTVPMYASSPDRPANKAYAAYQQNTVCLFAHKPLRPGRRYVVRVRARVDGRPWSRLWAFATQPPEDGPGRMFDGVLRQLNAHRKAAGLGPVRRDDAVSRACQAHAEYLARHLDRVADLSVGEEREDLEGYTKEGADVGKRSAIRLGGGSGPADAIDWLMTSVLNRNLVLNPSIEEVGLGAAVHSPRGWIWVVHLPGLRKRGDGPPVAFPGAGQKAVPLFFARDVREIVPEAAADARAGFPITLTFFPLAKVTRVRASLSADGTEVPAWLSTPEKRLPGTGTYVQVVLVPKAPLEPNTDYRVCVMAEVDGAPLTREWSFTTHDPTEEERRTGEHLLAQVNAHRKNAGLGAVEMDEALSRGCRLHAEYVVRNIDDPKTQGLSIHDEERSLGGFTEAGQKAGKAAVIAVLSEPADSVDMWMGTLYHRLPLLDAGLKRIGYGQRQHPTRGWVTVLDAGNGKE